MPTLKAGVLRQKEGEEHEFPTGKKNYRGDLLPGRKLCGLRKKIQKAGTLTGS